MKKICAAVVLIICSFIIFIPQVSAQDMVWLYSDSERTDYVDNDTIERGGNYSDYDFGAVIVTYYNFYTSGGVFYVKSSQGFHGMVDPYKTPVVYNLANFVRNNFRF